MYTYIPLWEEFWQMLLGSMASLGGGIFLIWKMFNRKKPCKNREGLIFLLAMVLVYTGVGVYTATDIYSVIRNEDVITVVGEFEEARKAKFGPEYVFIEENGMRHKVSMGMSGLDYFMGEDFEFEQGVQYRITYARGYHTLVGIEVPGEE